MGKKKLQMNNHSMNKLPQHTFKGILKPLTAGAICRILKREQERLNINPNTSGEV